MTKQVDPEKKSSRMQPLAQRTAGCNPFFAAIGGVMLRAKRQRLEPEDLLLVYPSDSVELMSEGIKANWERELARAEAEKKAHQPGDKKKPRPASIASAMWPLIFPLWIVAISAFAVAVGLSFVGPLLLTFAVRLIADVNLCAVREESVALVAADVSDHCQDSNDLYMGYVYAGLMLLSKMVEGLCQAWHAHLMTRVALRARSGLISMIYRKCLWLSGIGGSDATLGKVQNLMANDAQFFLQFAPLLNNLFAAPVQIIVAFVWLATLIGPSFLAGLAMMFIAVPIQGTVIAKYFKYQVQRLKLTDERVKLSNEMVQGIRVIKMYAWEQTIASKIAAIRSQELALVRSQRLLSAALSLFMVVQPLLVTVVTFSVYGAALGNELKAQTVLPAMSLFALLRLPLAFLPTMAMQLANLKVAMQRITQFLMNEELPAHIKARSLAAAQDSTEPSPPTKPCGASHSTPYPAMTSSSSAADEASADAAQSATEDVVLRGSFAWPEPEVPAGKGKGKGKGGSGKGEADKGGGHGRSGGRGRGGADTDPNVRVGMFRRKPLRAEPEPKPKAPPKPTLHELDIVFPQGQLTMVAGAVGSGKSSLLCALLGEMKPVAEPTAAPLPTAEAKVVGDDAQAKAEAAAAVAAAAAVVAPASEVRLQGQAGFFSQTAFILNDTVQGNILLGAPLDEAYYQQVLAACALLPDLEILPGGDMTQIGEKGINLSGGQKARVALARACYSRASTILLDDPLSAVDAHVGKHIFREVLGPRGLLAGTTRILVTHQTQFLPLADRVVVLNQGSVLAQGTYDAVRSCGADLSAIQSLSDGAEVDLDALLGVDVAEEAHDTGAEASLTVPKSTEGAILVKDEERATGSVSWATHLIYLKAAGGVCFGVILLLACFWERFCIVATDYWLMIWINPSTVSWGKHLPARTEYDFWISIYFGGVVAAGVSVYARAVFMGVVMGLRTARVLYERLSKSILSAPMIFFETTPSGRILNRFTSDTQQMDFDLLMMMGQWINCISSVIGALVLICIVNPWFLCTMPVFALIYTLFYYVSCSATRDLQRLEAVSRSPIYTQFSETLNGLSTIRAFGATRRFEAQSLELTASNTKCFFNQDMANQWISLRLDFCSAAISAITVLLPILTIQFGNTMAASPAAFGLCITYALELSAFLKFGTKCTLDLQKGMAAVERIVEYATCVQSEPTGGNPLPTASWPASGRIVATNLCVRYRPELPLALEDVSCVIEPRAKVGVVGRTGSGKTTFVSALWRLVEPTQGADGPRAGALSIDGTDLSTLELSALRSRLAIIVQDPVLFNDSLRYNLDPFSEHSDEALKQVLKHAQLEAPLAKLGRGLDSPVGEAGVNFSVGQRQLICLARAMLRRSTVVVLDEATASIDNETDAILQACIREVFADATVLTIAHRLHTIMDSTQIMLFHKGALKEHDAPEVLLADEGSLFSQLVADTGSAAQHLRTLAAEGALARRQAGS